MSFQWPAVTFSERAPTTNPFLTKSKKSDDRHVQRIRRKCGRRSYLSVGVGGDSQSLLEREPTRSEDRGLLSYNIDIQCKGIILKGILNTSSPKNKYVIKSLFKIEGSTDRCCIAIVTNERALLSGSDQPVQNLGRHCIYACKTGKQTFKDCHIWSMVYGALLMSATDTN